MPTFDGENLLITLDAGVSQVDAQEDLYEPWKAFVLGFSSTGVRNSRFPPAFRSVGGDSLTPGIKAGAYFFIRNDLGWRIKPAEEDATVLLTGNLAPEDSTLPILVPTIGDFSVLIAGLQPITQNVSEILTAQQDSAYNGVIAIDTIGGSAGTTFPLGTRSDPVNNLADAITIANNLSLRAFELTGVVVLTQAFQFWRFKGASAVAEVVLNGQDCSGTVFEGIGLSGASPALTQDIVLLNGRVSSGGLTDFMGAIAGSVIQGNVSAAGDITVANCASHIAGTGQPILNAQGNALDISVRKYTGGLELQNFSNASGSASFDIDGGTMVFAASCTNGTAVLRGIGTKDDQSAGMTLTDDGFIDGLDLQLIKAVDANRAVITDLGTHFQVDIYADDQVTILRSMNVSTDGLTRTVV